MPLPFLALAPLIISAIGTGAQVAGSRKAIKRQRKDQEKYEEKEKEITRARTERERRRSMYDVEMEGKKIGLDRDKFTWKKGEFSKDIAEREDDRQYSHKRDDILDKEDDEIFAHLKEREGVDDKRYRDAFDYMKSRDKVGDKRYKNEFAYKKTRDTKGDAERKDEFEYGKGRDTLADAERADERKYYHGRVKLEDKERRLDKRHIRHVLRRQDAREKAIFNYGKIHDDMMRRERGEERQYEQNRFISGRKKDKAARKYQRERELKAIHRAAKGIMGEQFKTKQEYYNALQKREMEDLVRKYKDSERKYAENKEKEVKDMLEKNMLINAGIDPRSFKSKEDYASHMYQKAMANKRIGDYQERVKNQQLNQAIENLMRLR